MAVMSSRPLMLRGMVIVPSWLLASKGVAIAAIDIKGGGGAVMGLGVEWRWWASREVGVEGRWWVVVAVVDVEG